MSGPWIPVLRRGLAGLGVAGALLAATAAPASAHASFAEVGVPASSDQRLTMFVPEERGPDVHNVAVDLRVPAGWSALGCEAAAPWSCQVAAGGVIKWTKAAGAPPVPADTLFYFTVRTGSPGVVGVPVVQTYDSGEVVRWIGPAESEEPAAFIEVLQPGTPPPPTTAPTTTNPPPETTVPAGGGDPTTTTAAPRTTTTTAVRPATTATTAPATTTTAPPETTVVETTTTVTEESTTTTAAPATTTTVIENAAPARSERSGGSGATGLLVLLALVLAAGAAVGWSQWRRRRPSGGPGEGEA